MLAVGFAVNKKLNVLLLCAGSLYSLWFSGEGPLSTAGYAYIMYSCQHVRLPWRSQVLPLLAAALSSFAVIETHGLASPNTED